MADDENFPPEDASGSGREPGPDERFPEDGSGFEDQAGTDYDNGSDDLGEPIEELRGFQEAASTGLVGRVVRSLRRRSLSSQFAALGWTGFGQVILEFLTMIFSLFEPPRGGQGEND